MFIVCTLGLVNWGHKYRIYYVDVEAEAKPRLNFPKEDKPHNIRVDVVDPASTTDITCKSS